MILNNINKIYKTKTEYVNALSDINIEFPNKGMVFILGKSGSGKSTLLNILGGLDKPSSGDLIIDNENLYDKSSKELNEYRRNHIGFIFQDYNLIKGLSVIDNINLNKKENVNTLDILEKLDILELKDRKVTEISGGQAQRVAIARALAKDPSILLCDEPTGALDSSNSEELFNILKEISKDILVIVVSHEKEYADKYNDYKIVLKDGLVIENTCKKNNEEKILKDNNIKLSNKITTKIGFKYLIKEKLSFILSIILLTISLALLGGTLSISKYDALQKGINIIKEEGWNYYSTGVDLSNLDEENFINSSYGSKTNEFIKKETGVSDFVYRYSFSLDIGSYFNKSIQYETLGALEYTKDNLDRLNIKLIAGEEPVLDNHIIISDYIGNLFIENGYMDKSINSYNDLIDLEIDEFIICGVMDTNHPEFIYKNNIDSTDIDFIMANDYGILSSIFVKEGSLEYGYVDEVIRCNISVGDYESISYSSEYIMYNDNLNNIYKLREFKDGDIIISLQELLYIITNDRNAYENELEEAKEILNTNNINDCFMYIASNFLTEEMKYYISSMKFSKREFNIVGVFNSDLEDYNMYSAIISKDDYKNYFSLTSDNYIDYLLISSNNSMNTNKRIISLMNTYKMYSYEDCTIKFRFNCSNALDQTNALYYSFDKFNIWFCIGSIILLLLVGFIFAYLINQSIVRYKKDYGILLSLGSGNIRCCYILYLKYLICSVISSIISIFISIYLLDLFLDLSLLGYNNIYDFKLYDGVSFILVFIISIIIPFLISLIPLIKFNKNKPIDIIKKIY